jgi:ribosomal-protein-alanine acetyltransferase
LESALFENVVIRPAVPADVRFMTMLGQGIPTAAYWTKDQYAALFGAGAAERLVLVAEDIKLSADQPKPFRLFLGFLVARHTAAEWELENVVVGLSGQRNGVGTKLLSALLAKARETNSEAVYLEVRESNAPARNLYARAGFEQAGRRKAYYKNPAEDAILYRWLPIKP